MPLHLRLLLPALTLALGSGLGFIQPTGLLLGSAFVIVLLAGQSHLPNWLWLPLILLGGIALAAHLIPGFSPWQLWQPRLISADAAPYGLRLSWDKLLLGSALLAWWLGQPRSPVISLKHAWLACIATLLLVPLLAMALGLVAWQPKWPQGLLLWLAVNLGVAVLAEELLFRGLLQTALIKRLGIWPGLLLTAGLFGAAHLPFSPLFAVVATCAGLGYGLVFHYSGRLSLAIALHTAVNLLHILLLSYPLRLA
ncbi:CPBP family intramembrane glutamic endopeptidase [Ectopseudomonas alcaliphila]|uniref:CPBP family intramembrane glutamic endopeptidase n=1 Tax=Ectopseudomonas alcaliphila TaxID=101564 RepID=UPI002784E21A|nr:MULTISPECIES: type II CAAX endopeptidase family protein [Pseudomonas]MDP9940176.1 membrane protease YdiL (CAAX protease family) [Pseudomonas sp. 3400]MDR7012258.1 membrane protease YdiL (CAAX protease family) [Pseudomonas alcaliphila]